MLGRLSQLAQSSGRQGENVLGSLPMLSQAQLNQLSRYADGGGGSGKLTQLVNWVIDVINHPYKIAAFFVMLFASIYLLLRYLKINTLDDAVLFSADIISKGVIYSAKICLDLPMKIILATVEVSMQKLKSSTSYIIGKLKLPSVKIPLKLP